MLVDIGYSLIKRRFKFRLGKQVKEIFRETVKKLHFSAFDFQNGQRLLNGHCLKESS